MKKNTKNTKKTNISEVLLFIVVVVIMQLVGYFRNDENYAVAGEEPQTSSITFNMESIPEYTNEPYVSIDNNKPAFKPEEYTTTAFETYSELDNLGRCRSSVCKHLQRNNAKRWRTKTGNKYD